MRNTHWLGVGVVVGGLAAQASAAMVTYNAQGTIDFKDPGGAMFPAALAGVGAGDTFELSVTFDTTAAADGNANPNEGSYTLPLGTYSAELRLGSATASLSASGPLQVSITNNFGVLDIVEFVLGDRTDGNGFFTADDVIFTIVLPNSAFSSDAIPTSIGAIGPTSNFSYSSSLNLNPFFPTPATMGGTVTAVEIVPAPAGLTLLSAGGVIAGLRRRR